MKTLNALQRFWLDESGGESVEWPLVVGLVVLGLVGLWAALQTSIGNVLTAIQGELADSIPGE